MILPGFRFLRILVAQESEVGFGLGNVKRGCSHIFCHNLINRVGALCGQAEVGREDADLIRQLGMLVRSDSLEPVFNDVERRP